MNWYTTIKGYYEKGLWEQWQVARAVQYGKITPEQYTEITGDTYEPSDAIDPSTIA